MSGVWGKKINLPFSINYKTADNSASSSLYEDCLWARDYAPFLFLWVNLSFTEQLSVSICGISGFF